MSLLHAIFGAKPPYGTPPFALPHINTGGSEVPTTADNQGRPHGLSGFIDRLAYPTNGIGQIGLALLAGGGGGLGNAAQLLMAQGEARRKAQMPNIEHVGDSIGVVDPNTGKYTPTYTAPKDATGFAGELQAAGIDPSSPEGVAALKQHVENSLDPYTTFSGPQGSYFGPRSGLPSALGLPSGAPTPVGKITPIPDPAPADAPPAGGGKADYPAFKKAIIGQETGGRYGIPNAQGSGAMGIGQVMPDTARVLAGRLGLPYRPDLLAGTDPTAQGYQNQITDAAAREAWQAANGDPAIAAMYYFGGSNRSKWGPKTHGYASDILSRLGS